MKDDKPDYQRRKLLKSGFIAGTAVSFPAFVLPALAQGETLVPFTDMPADFQPGPARAGANHILDTRQISSFYTDNQDFYVIQHYGQPELDSDTFSLKISGLVDSPKQFSLSELKSRPQIELDAGFECGGNQGRVFHGLIGNARWKGVRLTELLKECGVQKDGKEIVFFGGDIGEEKIRNKTVKQSFGRSLSIDDAMNDDIILALEMNGEPLPLYHGKPLRLIVPGWYGVANVKWLSQIHVQNTRFMGRFMARDYVTLKKDNLGGEERWVESSVAKMNLKSIVSRIIKNGDKYKISGFVLNDGTPLKSVEIKVDDGPWQTAILDAKNTRYSWKLFSFDWGTAPPGDHTVVSRVTDINDHRQASVEDLPEKATYWEDFGQFPRTFTI